MGLKMTKISKQYEILSEIRYLSSSIKIVQKQIEALTDTNVIKPSVHFVFHNTEEEAKLANQKLSYEDMMMGFGSTNRYVPQIISVNVGDTDMIILLDSLRKILIKRKKVLIKSLEP